MEGGSGGTGLAQGISGTAQWRNRGQKVAVIAACVMNVCTGMEMEDPFIFNLDTRCGDRSNRDGGRGPSLMSQTVVLAIFTGVILL